jgi:hypothetical protein
MGYDVHITRADPWTDSEADPITVEQWLDYVEQDPEMRWKGRAEAAAPNGDVIRVESPGLSVWTAYSGNNLNGNLAWFHWGRGRVIVKNPDSEVLGKMKRIAEYFKANVVGDDGESY